MNLFSKGVRLYTTMSRDAYVELMKKRENDILESFRIHKTPTATAKALGNGMTRWVVMRVAMRAGLWNQTAKEKARSERNAHIDRNASIYNRTSKIYRDEYVFQSKISGLLTNLGLEFQSEYQVIKGVKARCDFFSNTFIIEAKNTVSHDELCRGLGQCMIYKGEFPEKRICVVYPSDLSPKEHITRHFICNGISILSENELEKWLR